MSPFEIIGAILIGPLKLIFEVIFSLAYSVLNHPGLAIIVLSLAMNIMVLPLYRRADAIQIEARDTENRLKDVVKHIKKTFSGDEQMMILQTYYRQNNYNPLSILSGSISLLLEIPFFMAAYQFLSSVGAFSGASFGPISDLSVPDGLLTIGSFTVNVLPFIMTLINVLSSSLYLKGFPLKTKIQLYGMALFFLVFLYNSPAALVFYWTLNNAFSLFKNLLSRLKYSRIILNTFLAVVGAAGFAISVTLTSGIISIVVIFLSVAAQLPWLLPLLKKQMQKFKKQDKVEKPNKTLFLVGALFLAILSGLFIPSTFVAASPQEYIDTSYFYNPIWYVVNSLCLSMGTFLVWLGVFYWLANDAGKVFFSRLVWILSVIMLANYMFFGTKLGALSPDLHYTDGFVFSAKEQLVNLAVVFGLIVAGYFLVKKFPKKVMSVLLICTIALSGMSLLNVVKTCKSAGDTKIQIAESAEQMPSFTLSEDGKNVVVLILDRAIGPFVPYMMEENPNLQEQFDGFTYYSNALSYGGFTNLATPALCGGYEYTPVSINLRDSETLADKHDEALKVVPTLFGNAGYDVTVIDPPYAGYEWISDLSIYDDIPGAEAYLAEGKFNDTQAHLNSIASRKRNFFLFSIMKTLPVSAQPYLYDDGIYCSVRSNSGERDTTHVYSGFMNAYHVLENMETMTNIIPGDKNTYLNMHSNATHEAIVLQEPDFVPYSYRDNSAFYPSEGKTITAGDQSYLLSDDYKISHYHVNMSTFIQLGRWFDYLRDNGVYDNTRIILVSDHGRDIGVFDEVAGSGADQDLTDDALNMRDIEFYLPLLMVKDFDAEDFTHSDSFMTIADVASLSMAGLIDNPVNPFTGKAINDSAKTETDKHYVTLSPDFSTEINNGNQFLPSEWATVSGNVNDRSNWEFHAEFSVLPPDMQN